MVRVFGDYLCRDGEYIWKLVLYRGGGVYLEIGFVVTVSIFRD